MPFNYGFQVDEPDFMSVGPSVKHWRGESSLKDSERMLILLGSLEERSEVQDCLRSRYLQIHHSLISFLSLLVVTEVLK
jgi:hypothetical protein